MHPGFPLYTECAHLFLKRAPERFEEFCFLISSVAESCRTEPDFRNVFCGTGKWQEVSTKRLKSGKPRRSTRDGGTGRQKKKQKKKNKKEEEDEEEVEEEEEQQ